jgi:hypothetical protein
VFVAIDDEKLRSEDIKIDFLQKTGSLPWSHVSQCCGWTLLASKLAQGAYL